MSGACAHYNRGCELVAPCCHRAFACHVCHDDESECESRLDRRSMQQVVCLGCSTIQQLAPRSATCPRCVWCDMEFGQRHACTTCHIYSHNKEMWHCDKCGICRLGAQGDYMHCEVCDACVPHGIDHQCAKDAMHRECIVCHKYLFTSRTQVAQLSGCGHLAAHLSCLRDAEAAPGATFRLACPHCLLPSGSGVGGWLEAMQWSDEDGPCLRLESCMRADREDSRLYLDGPDGGATRGPYIRRFNDLPRLVLPTDDENEAGSAAVIRVQLVLQRLSSLPVSRVHPGGSFGRKTHVRGRFDVDMLIFANSFDTADSARAQMVLTEAAEELERRIPDVEIKMKPGMQMLTLVVPVGGVGGGVEMDVLVVRNVASPQVPNVHLQQVEAFVRPLLRMTAGQITAMAAVPLDRARERAVGEALTVYVKEMHPTANNAVRLFKAWVKCGLVERGLLRCKKLPSIALELIVLEAFRREAGQTAQDGPFDNIRGSRSLLLRTFLRALHTASRLTEPGLLVMLDAGKELGYRRMDGLRFRACWGSSSPYVIHPIDPTCNVARDPENGRPPWDWAGLARQAEVLLSVVRHCSLEVLMRESTLGAALYRLRHDL